MEEKKKVVLLLFILFFFSADARLVFHPVLLWYCWCLRHNMENSMSFDAYPSVSL